MIHLLVMSPFLIAGSAVGAVKFGSTLISNLRESMERIEQRAIAKESACVCRLKVMHSHELERESHRRIQLEKSLVAQGSVSDDKGAILGTSLQKARNYWFAKDPSWLHPAKDARNKEYVDHCKSCEKCCEEHKQRLLRIEEYLIEG